MPTSIFTDTIASGASTSAGINLGTRGYQNCYVTVPTMSTAVQVSVWGSADGGTTVYQLMSPQVNTSTVTFNSFVIATGVGTNGGILQVPLYGLNYLKFIGTGVVSGGVGFKIICNSQGY